MEGLTMASGWGITGNKGRCYDFWTDFSECMSKCREPKDCALLREDYLECLHHSKEVKNITFGFYYMIYGDYERGSVVGESSFCMCGTFCCRISSPI